MQAAGSIVSRLLRELGLESGLRGWQAVRDWPEMVGPRIAHRTRAVEYRDGVLRVEVESAVWAFELRLLERRLIQEIDRRLGPGCVRRLQFVQTRGGIRR